MLRSFNNILFFNTIARLVHASLVFYPTPAHLAFSFSFGFLSGLFLIIQIVTGVLLTMFYVPHVLLAFDSIQFVMREVNYGFLLRYLHLSGASFFFLVIYVHMAKALFYSSPSTPRRSVWIVGVLIFFLLMGTAFLGYVLVWGQMSFWAATVITNLLTVIPLVGNNLTSWIWGGFAINESTLTRFFSIHFLLPFLIALLSIYHLFLLHQTHSSNPIGSFTPSHLLVRFYPFFYIKDLLVALCILFVYFFIVCFYPEILNHPDNYVPADALKTPASIVPEIYFLPFYGLLKSILNKSMGIAAMFASILILFVLPTRSPGAFKNLNNQAFTGLYFFIANFIILGIVGEKTPTTFLLSIGQLCSHLYFIYLLVLYQEESVVYNKEDYASHSSKHEGFHLVKACIRFMVIELEVAFLRVWRYVSGEAAYISDELLHSTHRAAVQELDEQFSKFAEELMFVYKEQHDSSMRWEKEADAWCYAKIDDYKSLLLARLAKHKSSMPILAAFIEALARALKFIVYYENKVIQFLAYYVEKGIKNVPSLIKFIKEVPVSEWLPRLWRNIKSKIQSFLKT